MGSKKLLTLVLPLLVIIGVIVAFMSLNNTVSKEDLQASLNKLNEVAELEEKEPATSPQDIASAKTAQAEFRIILDNWDKANGELLETNGLDHKDVEDAYEAYEAASENHKQFGEDIHDSVVAVGAFVECAEVLSSVDQESVAAALVAPATECKQSIAEVGAVPIDAYQQLLTATTEVMDATIAFANDNDAAAFDAAATKYQEATTTIFSEDPTEEQNDKYDQAVDELKSALEAAVANS